MGERLQQSFNGKLRDEPLTMAMFRTPAEAELLIEAWHRHYNTERPQSSPGYRPPKPETAGPPSRPC